MEEGEAAPVGRQPALEILQRPHPVDLLVAQELLQQRGRAVPVDAGEGQEARVEPAGQQVVQVGVDRRQLGMVGQMAPAAARADRRSPRVPPGAMFMRRNSSWRGASQARRSAWTAAGRRARRGRPRRRPGSAPGRHRSPRPACVKKASRSALGHGPVGFDQLARQGRAGGLAPGREQVAAQALDRRAGAGRRGGRARDRGRRRRSTSTADPACPIALRRVPQCPAPSYRIVASIRLTRGRPRSASPRAGGRARGSCRCFPPDAPLR